MAAEDAALAVLCEVRHPKDPFARRPHAWGQRQVFSPAPPVMPLHPGPHTHSHHPISLGSLRFRNFPFPDGGFPIWEAGMKTPGSSRMQTCTKPVRTPCFVAGTHFPLFFLTGPTRSQPPGAPPLTQLSTKMLFPEDLPQPSSPESSLPFTSPRTFIIRNRLVYHLVSAFTSDPQTDVHGTRDSVSPAPCCISSPQTRAWRSINLYWMSQSEHLNEQKLFHMYFLVKFKAASECLSPANNLTSS